MLPLHQLKDLQYHKILRFLEMSLRIGRNDRVSPATILAAAYAAVRLWEGADGRSLEAFLAGETDSELAAFLHEQLGAVWERVRDAYTAFEEDMFAAFLLFDNVLTDRPEMQETPESLAQLAIRLLDPAPGMQTVDFGAGWGRFLRELAVSGHGAGGIGYEIDKEARCIAKMRTALMPGVTIAGEDVLRIPAGEPQFDRIFLHPTFRGRIQDVHDTGNVGLCLLEQRLPVVKQTLSPGGAAASQGGWPTRLPRHERSDLERQRPRGAALAARERDARDRDRTAAADAGVLDRVRHDARAQSWE